MQGRDVPNQMPRHYQTGGGFAGSRFMMKNATRRVEMTGGGPGTVAFGSSAAPQSSLFGASNAFSFGSQQSRAAPQQSSPTGFSFGSSSTKPQGPRLKSM